MERNDMPMGFGRVLEQNTAAMNRFAHLEEPQRQEVLRKARSVRTEKEMYALVASLANGIME